MKHARYLKKLPSLKGKVCAVTGANSGIGFYTAMHFAYLGAKVILACRNRKRAEEAVDKILLEVPNAKLEIMAYDQSDFASIDAFAAHFKSGRKLDILVCNAGVYYQKRNLTTKEGFELTMGTNYFGTYRLLSDMRAYLKRQGTRVVVVTSLVAILARKGIKLSDELAIDRHQSYRFSKKCLSRLMVELSGELNITLSHPGTAATNIITSQDTGMPHWIQVAGHRLLTLFTHSAKKASFTSVVAATCPLDKKRFVKPRGILAISGYPKRCRLPRYAQKPIIAETKDYLAFREIE